MEISRKGRLDILKTQRDITSATIVIPAIFECALFSNIRNSIKVNLFFNPMRGLCGVPVCRKKYFFCQCQASTPHIFTISSSRALRRISKCLCHKAPIVEDCCCCANPLHLKHKVTGIFESYHGHFVAFGPCRLSWLAPFSAQVSSRR